MGFLKPKKYRPDPEIEDALKKQREEEERIQKEQDEEEERRKKRFISGKLGQRSLFARAGGRGFYTEGKET